MANASIEVYNEVDNVVYTFNDSRAAEYWALSGEPTWSGIRPAQPADRAGFALTDFFQA